MIAALTALFIALRRFAVVLAVAYSAVFVVVVAVCATRTPKAAAESRVALRIDVKKSNRMGPLLDERRLLADEVDWARARGDAARVRATSNEIAAIDRLLSEINR